MLLQNGKSTLVVQPWKKWCVCPLPGILQLNHVLVHVPLYLGASVFPQHWKIKMNIRCLINDINKNIYFPWCWLCICWSWNGTESYNNLLWYCDMFYDTSYPQKMTLGKFVTFVYIFAYKVVQFITVSTHWGIIPHTLIDQWLGVGKLPYALQSAILLLQHACNLAWVRHTSGQCWVHGSTGAWRHSHSW